MGNKGKEGQMFQGQMHDYERSRILRIQENQTKLQQFGVKNIAKSLTSLVESQSSGKKKRKGKPVVGQERDVEYIPDFGSDSEDNCEEEISKSGKVHTKVHPTQYIAPMSMNRYANLAKRRVIAHSAAEVLRSEEGMQLASSEVTKKSKIQSFEKDRLRNKTSVGTNATKQEKPRAKQSMRELINGSQKHARRKLFLVDNDGEEDVSFQDVNEGDGDKDFDEDDENENIDNRTLRNASEWNDGISQGVHEVHRNHNNLEDYTNERIDQFISDDEDNRQDGLEDDLEIEGDELALEQLIGYRSTKETAISKMKKRGPTMLHDIHTRSFDEREAIICNEFGQPIGPVVKEKNIAGQFSRFLGTIARNYSYAPLTYASWHKVPHKEKLWEYVLEKYVVPKDARDWVLQSIGASWRVHKCRIKSKHFYKYPDYKSRWNNRPKCIPEKDFATLLRLWSNKETLRRCSLARDRRKSQKNNHTAGPKSFARIREELRNEDPNKKSPKLSRMFEYTRRRTEGRSYVDTFDDTSMKIEKMKNYKPSEEESSDEDPFLAVMGKEYTGHRRLYGRGVTNKIIKRVGGEKLNMALSIELRRELDEEHERKKLELEEEHQRKKAELEAIRKAIDNQRDKSIEEALQKILQKLPVGIVQEFLT